MQKFIFILLFCLNFLSAISQVPILVETPKRGIYENFEDFKLNRPSIIDSFYIEREERSQENWEGTYSLTPRYADNNKKVKREWGFCDGENIYVYHQWEFFKVVLDSTKIGFYAYEELDNSKGIAAGIAGGAIGAGVYTAIATDKAKKKKIFYSIDLTTGKFISEYTHNKVSNDENKYVELILYRRDKKQTSAPLQVSINDTTTFQLIPNSIQEFKIHVSSKALKVCYGETLNLCFDVQISLEQVIYLEGSISIKTNQSLLEQVNTDSGEFNSKQARFFQERRENQK